MRNGNTEKIRAQAIRLARENKIAEPGITKVFWFPDEQEVRLVELEDGLPPSPNPTLNPFYFAPSAVDGLGAPSGIALIRSEEYGALELPEGWGSWERAEELEIGL